jgi:PIN domain nuclease of toxin-antitoxin system
MKLLLDTHALIWFLEGSSTLSLTAKNAILNQNNAKYISIVSIWEVVIKLSLGKIDLKMSLEDFIKLIENNGFILLHLSPNQIFQIVGMPFIHKDPFDRMLIAQCIADKLTLVSTDQYFSAYNINILW